MAVALDFDYSQSNDNKIITITDNTGAYDASTNTGGWGSPNQVVSDVVETTSTTASKYHLVLDIVYTDSSGTEYTYDEIDLYSNFSTEFTKSYGMIYSLDMSHIFINSASQGSSSDEFADGIYDITYTIKDANTSSVINSKNIVFLISGVIQNLVYDDLINSTSTVYKQKVFNSDERDYQDLMEALFLYSYYQSMLTDNDDSSKDTKIEMLYFLQQRLNS